ncbi:hypothetical protein CEXT_79761 [Caerostris extrusa]|uniref:Uncharacterized protein n=1 Tax=Caerostris extrusa TaxID=172846 RepID=A0AAV4TBP5_CAEEX|nr:hypothetical protein CEXT_79761 [Caerostris extrusa]
MEHFFPLLSQSNDFPQTKTSRLIRNPPRVPGPKIVSNHSNPPRARSFPPPSEMQMRSVCFNLSLETREPDCSPPPPEKAANWAMKVPGGPRPLNRELDDEREGRLIRPLRSPETEKFPALCVFKGVTRMLRVFV